MRAFVVVAIRRTHENGGLQMGYRARLVGAADDAAAIAAAGEAFRADEPDALFLNPAALEITVEALENVGVRLPATTGHKG